MATKKAYVALLRGINVGGKNRLPMADLLARARASSSPRKPKARSCVSPLRK